MDADKAEKARVRQRRYYAAHRERANAATRKWQHDHPAQARENTYRWRADHPAIVQAIRRRSAERDRLAGYVAPGRARTELKSRLKRLYGMTVDQYDALLREQHGGCALCGSTTRLAVDHDHATGVVRGLLCVRCNSALAMVEEAGWPEKAARYLKRASG